MMIVRNFQRIHSTFPFSSETASSLSGRSGFGEQCIHHQLYGEFDLQIVCCDGESGIHQAVLGHASKMMKEILIGDTMLLDNGDVLNVVNNKKEVKTMFLPDIKKSTVKNLLSVLYTGDVVMTSLEEAGELKALWRLLKIDLIHIKDLQILFETDSSNSKLDNCGNDSSDLSQVKTQVVDINRKRSPRWKRSRSVLHRTKRGFRLHPLQNKKKKPANKKLLKIFERFLSQTLNTKLTPGKKGEELKEDTHVTSVEPADSEQVITADNDDKADTGNLITVEHTEASQSRSTIIHPTTPMITQNTMSYEDVNFSYDIDLLASDIIEQDTIYHQPQDTIYQSHDSIYDSHDPIYESQNQSVCIPVIQEDQVPLQLPLSYMQRPSIFVPVSFQDQLNVQNDASTTFSFLSTPEKLTTRSLSPKQGSKPSRINLKRKHEVSEEVYDTDGFALQPNVQNEEFADILDTFKNSGEDTSQITSKKFIKPLPKFRENNNWIGKLPKPEGRWAEKPRQKVKLTISFCKKINLIKDISSSKSKIKLNHKFTNHIHEKTTSLSNGDLPNETQVTSETGGKKQSREKELSAYQHSLKIAKRHDLGLNNMKKTSRENDANTEKAQVQETSDIASKSPKKKLARFEEQKYEMDEKLIETYLRNQTKLNVIHKWKIEPFLDLYDKSNDKNLRRQNKIRTSLVDLPNVLECWEGKFYYPQEAKDTPKRKSTCFKQLREISAKSALQAVSLLKSRVLRPPQTSEQIVTDLIDTIIKAAVLPKSINLPSMASGKNTVVDSIIDSIIASVVKRTHLQHSKI